MTAVTEWITQIILLILLAMILELILPNEGYQKYVKMVIGLVLIVALLNPIIKLFDVPVDHILDNFSLDQETAEINNSIKMKKNEIEAAQLEYKLNIMRVQMKNVVKEELVNRYDLAVQKIDITLNDADQTQLPVKHVNVLLGQAPTNKQQEEDSTPVNAVKEVKINISRDGSDTKAEDTSSKNEASKEVISFLAAKWGIPSSKLSVTMEGGGS